MLPPEVQARLLRRLFVVPDERIAVEERGEVSPRLPVTDALELLMVAGKPFVNKGVPEAGEVALLRKA